ncbi:hypothetical protein [Sulfurovum riftiae]|uniref:Helix-turn-helix domain-containing protein n=1 Tax=Sulfurovum riftiae TaxID=1630136 RepID=A0A151CJ35_9BACT|nr:hypothetical protein [Sulfurovum riftiae]KYJ87521.1 hypothetical protein AS592_10465 [Sulfurovum riftiae]
MDYSKMLFEKYHTMMLTTEQLSKIIDRSVASLESDRRAGKGIPFKRIGGYPNSPIRYPIHEVSTYLNSVERTV